MAYLNTNVKTDTTRTTWVEQLKESKVIKEKTTITEYDKDTGNPTKKTETEREIAQDTDKVSTQEIQNGISEKSNNNLNSTFNESKNENSEVNEESIGGQESFGKWLGIVIGIGIILGIIYLCKKLRIN